jgi:hypothetical protein
VARCCLDVATKQQTCQSPSSIPHQKEEEESLSSLILFVSVCVSPLFLSSSFSYKDVAAAVDIVMGFGASISPTYYNTDKLFLFLKCLVRIYDQKTDDLAVVTCHFAYFKQRQHTNTHTQRLTAKTQHAPSLLLLSPRMTFRKNGERWISLVTCYVWRRDVIFCHPRVIIIWLRPTFPYIMYNNIVSKK